MNCIVNADDFGKTENINLAVCEGFSRGVIQRTTLLVNLPFAEQAAELARRNGFSDRVGLHINLTEGVPLTERCRKNRVLCDENGVMTGEFRLSIKNRFILDRETTAAIAEETEAQIRRFLALGLPLRHADSHQYIHTYYSASRVILPLLEKYGFRSVRLSRNLTDSDESLPFLIYKALFNRYLRRRGIAASDRFGSRNDYLSFIRRRTLPECSVELMTHPFLLNGELYDNTDGEQKPFLTLREAEEAGLRFSP